MWALYLFTFNLLSSLSVLWAMSLASGLVAAGLWLTVAVKRRGRNFSESATTYSVPEYFRPPMDVKRIAVLCLLTCLLTIGYVRFVLAQPPVNEYTPERDGCCTIIGLSPDLSQWHLHMTSGDWWLDLCTGPGEKNPASYDPHVGMKITELKYIDHGCASTIEHGYGIVFDHSNRKELTK